MNDWEEHRVTSLLETNDFLGHHNWLRQLSGSIARMDVIQFKVHTKRRWLTKLGDFSSHVVVSGKVFLLPRWNVSHGWWYWELVLHKKCYRRKECSWCQGVFSVTKQRNLFLHCNFTTPLRTLLLNLHNTRWIMPEHTTDFLSRWIRKGEVKEDRDDGRFENRSNSNQKVKWKCIVSV